MTQPETLVRRAATHGDRVGVLDDTGATTYRELDRRSRSVAAALLGGHPSLDERRVAYLIQPGAAHVAVQWGIWRAGGIAVPLSSAHPEREIEYLLQDARVETAVTDAAHRDRLARPAAHSGIPLLDVERLGDAPSDRVLPPEELGARALMIYTSGTTGRPKGVVTTHANLRAQITTLVDAWGWRASDRALHVLPLHHVHGLVNVMCCALWSGAICEFLPKFDPERVWERLSSGQISVFMAVPTIYARLIAAWEAVEPTRRQRWSRGASTLRLMVSGSAALPVAVLERWRDISGHILLERYGMTEIGMALSNPEDGERRAGTVGRPLPGVTVRLVDDNGLEVRPGEPGEIEVRGPQVFKEYWNRPEETNAAFRNGWFRTGDVALLDRGYYRILGRKSTDLIKSAGYKVSALEIEELLREHPAVSDGAVVGLPDPDLGERIVAAVVLRPGIEIDPRELTSWARARLASYKAPREIHFVSELPRNAMGKVVKPALRELLARP